MLFSCAHCPKTTNDYKSCVEEVYQHWMSVHSSDAFQFYVHIMMRCFYCDRTDTFQQLVDHHHEVHSGQTFAVVNIYDHSKCGLCTQPSENLLDHFNNTHEINLQTAPLNPVILDDEKLAKLLSYNANRYRCLNCDRIFESLAEIEFHHTIEHTDTQMAIETITKSTAPQMICDYCHVTIIDREKYLNHIEGHEYNFDCGKCDYKSGKLIEAVIHDKQQHRINSLNYRCLEFCEMLKHHFANTRVIFESGLVLFNHNLTNTTYGDIRILFDIFVEELMKIIKLKYKTEHETGDSSATTDMVTTPAVEPIEIPAKKVNRKPKRSSNLARSMNMKALRAQNRLINNLCIYGIPYFNNENKSVIFSNLCWKLQVNVFPRDIVKITRSTGQNSPLIVELKKFEVKERILQSAYMQQLWSSDLIHLPFGVPPTRVFINIHTTKLYGRMARIARNAMNNNMLHTFWITKFGFLVKRTVNSKDKIVLSSDELVNYINQRKQDNHSQITRIKQFYRSIEWISNSNNN